MIHDRARLEAIWADAALAWLVDRIRDRLERGAPLDGVVARRAPSDAER